MEDLPFIPSLRRRGKRGGYKFFAFTYCFDFFSNIDCNRTPCYAPSATNTTRCAELIDPGGKFVCYPMAVTRFC